MSVLCYHAVEPGWRSPLAVDPADFAEQCAWLARHREVVTLEDAVALLDERGRLPRGVCALTFDDGFASVLEHALPVLQQYRLPATVFLVAQTLAPQGQPVDWVDTPPPYPMRTLTRDEVLRLQDAGVAFGSHSWRHADLRGLG
ncbi:MAG: polysaccharide deacetylase family protein, partial [Mycobacteriales bacterium]